MCFIYNILIFSRHRDSWRYYNYFHRLRGEIVRKYYTIQFVFVRDVE